jgi:DNA-binding MarR family transcriptional regulator
MTHTLAGLVKAGLIKMAPSPDDGRSKCVSLTNEGRLFRNTAMARLQPDFEKMASSIPADRVAQILPQLAEIRSYLDHERD